MIAASLQHGIQGNSDGLCGLYGLINFAVIKKDIEADVQAGKTARQEAFRYFTTAAERLGLLTSNKLCEGYEWSELVEIFNFYSVRQCSDYMAVPLLTVFNNISKPTNETVLGSIIDGDGAVIGLTENGGHWVLVYGRYSDGGFSIIDPSYGDVKTKLKRLHSLIDGVAIIPSNSPFLRATDAKTH